MKPVSIPVAKPILPSFEQLTPLLKQIDETRLYSNWGPLTQRFERDIETHFGLGASSVAATGSGYLAILAALLASAGRAEPGRPLCFCPAWTFTATASAIQAAGYTPYFLDCDRESWVLDPEQLRTHPMLDQAAAVLVVGPFGRKVDIAAWEAFQLDTGCRVVIDAAPAFDRLERADFSALIPLCLSFHATKFLGCGEGGAVIQCDEAYTWSCRRVVNNGKSASQSVEGPNINGKLSEFAAAVGLAQLAQADLILEEFDAAHALYDAAFERAGLSLPDWSGTPPSRVYRFFDCGSADALERVTSRLQENGIDSRRWYGTGLQDEPAYAGLPQDRLDATRDTAGRWLGLPLYRGLREEDVERIARVLSTSF